MTVTHAPSPPSTAVVGVMDVRAPAVRTRGLAKSYGEQPALAGLDLGLAPREVLGFLGPNGAGKTTAIRILTGALRASAGSAEVLGVDPFRRTSAVSARVGFVPGDLRLPSHLTGEELLSLFAALRDSHAPDRDRLLARLEVPLGHRVGSLSKGYRQKLGIVQAFMSVPDLLLLDEPSSGLDPLAQEVLEDEICRAAARGAAVLLSSHVLREVEQVASRVLMLRKGRVVASSGLDELRAAAPYEVEVSGEVDLAEVRRIIGVEHVTMGGGQARFTASAASLDQVLAVLARGHVRNLRIAPADLETLFLRYYGEEEER